MWTSDLLLDSNAAIALMNGDAAIITKFPASLHSLLSVVVLAELLYGAEKSARRQENLRRVESFSATLPLLPCARSTAQICARVRTELRLKGKPIQYHDLRIAASAIEHGLTLVTRDAHFQHVDGLQTTTW